MKLVKGVIDRILEHHPFTPLTVARSCARWRKRCIWPRTQRFAPRSQAGQYPVERRGQGNHVYLGDFGLGKRPGMDTTLTAAGMAVGTPEYMAPEAAMGTGADARSDVYSLGVIIYEMLVGRLPFDERQPQLTALAHVDKPVPRPRRLNPRFPARLESVILRALEKDPTSRYVSAEELKQAYYDAVKEMDDSARRATYGVEEESGE
jgi:serine/threonine protein kinase